MDKERMTMNEFRHSSLCRVMANLLIWLMAFQGIPFQELSRSYQWDPKEFVETLRTMVSPFLPTEAHAASPIADAGPDRTMFKNQPAGALITLDGQASLDPDGDPIVYEWYGPFTSVEGAAPTVGVPDGEHTISLIVSDGTERSEPDSVQVTVSPCFEILSRAKSGKVQLTWPLQAGAVRYDIYRSAESDPANFQKIAETTSAYSTYLDYSVINETSYLYTVGAVSQAGTCFSSVVGSHPTVSRTIENYRPVIYSRPVSHAIVGVPFTSDVQAVDPNGTAVSYQLLTAPPGMLINGTTGLISFDPAQTGSYEVEIQSIDGGGLTALQSFSIQASEATDDNKAPIANAGLDQTAFVMQEVHLDGTGSSDPEGNPLTYSWTFKSLPAGSSAQLADDTSTTPTFTVDAPGVYEVELIVNDGIFNSPPDIVIINTENSKPVAEAGPDQKVLVGGTATLDGSSSSDVDGDPLTFQWAITTKPEDSAAMLSDPSAVDPTLGIDKAGTYSIELIVSDGFTFSDPDMVSLSTENRKPVANAGTDQKIFVGDTATLDGTASYDVDGDPLTFKWSLLNVPPESAATLSDPSDPRPSFYVDKPGTYQLQLIVNDGSIDSDADNVTVSTENRRPTADAGEDRSAFVGDDVTLDGSGSSDVDGDLLSFRWSFITIPEDSTAILSETDQVKATFTIDEPGNYVAQLIVSDGSLDSEADSVTISTTNRNPIANAGQDQTVFVSDPVQLDGSGSTDPDGDTLTYSWSLTSKPEGSSAALSDPSLQKPTFTADLPGTYVAQLIVNDGTLDSLADTVVVSTENSKPVSNAGTDQSAYVGDTVTLDGSGSSDADGHALTFKWSFTSKPSESVAALSDPSAVNPTFLMDKAGTYVAQLIVNDGTMDSDPDSVTISTLNNTPVASAGMDQVVLAGRTVSLNGSGSSDVDGNPLTYQWTLISRPSGSASALSNPATVAPSLTTDLAGDYVVQLIVNDGTENSDPDTVKITAISNSPPSITSSPVTTATAGSPYSYQVTATDPEGNAITFSLEAAPTGMTINTSTGLIQWLPGLSQVGNNNTVKVAATDSWGASVTQDFPIFVKDPTNIAPIVNAGPDQTITLPSTADLNGSVTDDGKPSGCTLTVLWSKVSGPGAVTFSAPTSPTTTASFSETGAYVLRLTANDEQDVGFDEVTVTVNDQTVADFIRPAVTVEVSPDSTYVGTSVTITVSATDNVGVISTSLTVNGAPVALDPSGHATFTSPVAGVFTAVGTATDAAGNVGSSSEQFVFLATGDTTNPIAAITSPADNTKLSAPTDIIGTASDANLIQYTLEYSVKDRNEFVPFATGTASVINGVLGKLDPTMMKNGLYDIRLTAVDASGNTTSTTKIYELTGEMKVGNFTVAFNDLTVPMAGIPITITRMYDSRMKSKGDFGIGWTLGLKNIEISVSGVLGADWQQTSSGGWFPTYSLTETKSHTITITYPDGKVDEFGVAVNPSSQQLVPLEMTTISFVPKPGTTSSLIPLDASPSDLWIQPVLGSVELLDISTLQPFDPQRFQLTASDGTVYVLNLKTGLESIKDTNGNTITFTTNGIIHSAGKSVLFARDAEGRITTITDPMGNTLQYAYDFYGDLISMTDQLGNTTRYTYNSSHGLIDIIDPRGIRGIRNEYDAEGRIIAHIDADGNRIEYTHNIDTRQEIVKDRLGNLNVYDYDIKGNVVAKTDPLGNTTTYTYDANNNKLSETDPLGNTTSWTYDAKNNKLSETKILKHPTDPTQNINVTTRYTYNALNKVLTTTDPLGRVSTNTYDAKGNLLTTTDPMGCTTTNTYDGAGNLLATTDCLGNVTRHEYDGQGNMLKQTDPLGNVTTYTYDGNGNRLTETAQGGGVTRYTYDSANRPTSVQDALGNISFTEYDKAGNIAAKVDPTGVRTVFVYNSANKLVRTNFPDGTFITAAYDAEGNRIAFTDQTGHTTVYQYDANKQLAKTTYPDDSTQTFGYDAAGRQTITTDALGNTTTRAYDSLGRLVSVTDPEGNITSFTYDLAGNQTRITDANGHATAFVYDANNQQSQTILSGGQTTTFTYDGLGRKTAETDAAGNTTQFAYDAKGNLLSVTDALGGVTRYEYDANSNRIAIIDARGNRTTFAFDLNNRPTSKTMPNGGVESYAYDPAGRQITKTDAKGQQIAYGYDARGLLTARTYPDGSMVQFTYTATGKRTTATDDRGIT
ncbi:MAG: hypothetical protein KKC76_19125, partial [Proteobacteria bacterium]|nr:hypothetical protein [Pseudomonadota bacterium]